MLRNLVCCAVFVATISPALADSTFPNSCSEIQFAYDAASNATLKAVCLRTDGSANPTSLTLQGISNENGMLKQGSGPATFQKSCGNIRITANGGGVLLSAQCRTNAGTSNPTSMPLNNISNNNGSLVQQ
jgi:CVNH domain-containing protein